MRKAHTAEPGLGAFAPHFHRSAVAQQLSGASSLVAGSPSSDHASGPHGGGVVESGAFTRESASLHASASFGSFQRSVTGGALMTSPSTKRALGGPAELSASHFRPDRAADSLSAFPAADYLSDSVLASLESPRGRSRPPSALPSEARQRDHDAMSRTAQPLSQRAASSSDAEPPQRQTTLALPLPAPSTSGASAVSSPARAARREGLRRRFNTNADDEYQKTSVIDTISLSELDKMKSLFDSHDRDHSGNIDADELQPLLEELGHPMPREQAADLLAQVDVNGNGLLEFGEFLQLVLIFKNVSQFRLYSDSKQMMAVDGATTGGADRALPGAAPQSWWALVQGAAAWAVDVLPFAHESLALWLWELLLLATCVYVTVAVVSVHAFADASESVAALSRAFDVTDIVATVIIGLEMTRQCITCTRVATRGGSSGSGNSTSAAGTAASGARQPTVRMLTSVRDIAASYVLSPRFALDVVAVAPLRLILDRAGAAPVASLVVAHARLLFLWHLGTIMARPTLADIDRNFVYFFLAFAPMATLAAVFVTIVHVAATIAFRIGLSVSYAESVYVVMYTFAGAGFGDIEPRSNDHRLFLAALCVLSMMVNGFVVGSIVSFFSASDVDSVRKNRLVQTLAVLEFFHVPRPLQEEILQFQNHLQKNIQVGFAGVVDSLPTEMKVGLGLQVRIQLVRTVELFRMAHAATQIALAQELFTAVLCPEEFVALAHEEGEEMFFLSYGFVDILSAGGVYIQTLRSFESFGAEVVLGPVEDAIRTHRLLGRDDDAPLDIVTWARYLYSAKTLTYVELLGIDVATLDVTLRRFPRFRKSVEEALCKPGTARHRFGTSIKRGASRALGSGAAAAASLRASPAASPATGSLDATHVFPSDSVRASSVRAAGSVLDSAAADGSVAVGHDAVSELGDCPGAVPTDAELLEQSRAVANESQRDAVEGGLGLERRHTRGRDVRRAQPEVRRRLQELHVADVIGEGSQLFDFDDAAGRMMQSATFESRAAFEASAAFAGKDDAGPALGGDVGAAVAAAVATDQDLVLTPAVRDAWLAELACLDVALASALTEAATGHAETRSSGDTLERGATDSPPAPGVRSTTSSTAALTAAQDAPAGADATAAIINPLSARAAAAAAAAHDNAGERGSIVAPNVTLTAAAAADADVFDEPIESAPIVIDIDESSNGETA
jgi:hypothetical protein